jgi:hypothetical protein
MAQAPTLRCGRDLFQKMARIVRATGCVDLERQLLRYQRLAEHPEAAPNLGFLDLRPEHRTGSGPPVAEAPHTAAGHCWTLADPARLLARPFLLGAVISELDLLIVADCDGGPDPAAVALAQLLGPCVATVGIGGEQPSAALGGIGAVLHLHAQQQGAMSCVAALALLVERLGKSGVPTCAAGTGLLQMRSLVSALQAPLHEAGALASLARMRRQSEASDTEGAQEMQRRIDLQARVAAHAMERELLAQLTELLDLAFGAKLEFWNAARGDVWPQHLGSSLAVELDSPAFTDALLTQLKEAVHGAIDAAIVAERRRRATAISALPAGASGRDRFWSRIETRLRESDLRVDVAGESSRVMSGMIVRHAQEVEKQLTDRLQRDFAKLRGRITLELGRLGLDEAFADIAAPLDEAENALRRVAKDVTAQKSADVIGALGDLKVKWAPRVAEFWASLKWARGFFMFFVQIAVLVGIPAILFLLGEDQQARNFAGKSMLFVFGLALAFSLFFCDVRGRMMRHARVEQFTEESERCLDDALRAYHRDVVRTIAQEAAGALAQVRTAMVKRVEARERQIDAAQRTLATAAPARVVEPRPAPPAPRTGPGELASIDADLARAMQEWEQAVKKLTQAPPVAPAVKLRTG